MKQKLLLFLLFLTGMVQGAMAQEREAYVAVSADGKTVTFYYDDQKANRSGVVEINNKELNYYNSNAYGTAATAVFDASFADYRPTSTAYWFMRCLKLEAIMGMENLNTSNVTDMGSMFYECSALTTLDVSNFNTSNVTNMSCIFRGCQFLKNIDVSNFNTSNVTDMALMFYGCSALTSLDLSNFNTSNVTDMYGMFYYCSSLTSLDLSNFNTSNVTNMSFMFYKCSDLTTIYADEAKWSTTNVTSGSGMFLDSKNLVGGNGTKCSNFRTSHEYACIDKPGQPGYLTQKSGSGIATAKQDGGMAVDVSYYDLNGRPVTADYRGIMIRKNTYADGTTTSEKVVK